MCGIVATKNRQITSISLGVYVTYQSTRGTDKYSMIHR